MKRTELAYYTQSSFPLHRIHLRLELHDVCLELLRGLLKSLDKALA